MSTLPYIISGHIKSKGVQRRKNMTQCIKTYDTVSDHGYTSVPKYVYKSFSLPDVPQSSKIYKLLDSRKKKLENVFFCHTITDNLAKNAVFREEEKQSPLFFVKLQNSISTLFFSINFA